MPLLFVHVMDLQIDLIKYNSINMEPPELPTDHPMVLFDSRNSYLIKLNKDLAINLLEVRGSSESSIHDGQYLINYIPKEEPNQ